MNSNSDFAVVDINSSNVTVNGSNVGSGLAASDVQQIVVNGLTTTTNQTVAFNGDFAAIGNNLQNVNVSNVNQVSFNGTYDIAQNLDIALVGTGGRVGDGSNDGGRVRVAGQTTITANANEVSLDNVTNDFNNVSISTTGTGNSVSLGEINDINFNGVAVSGDLSVNAGGDVTDSVGTSMVVSGDGNFSANNVILGGQGTGENTRFFGTSFNVSGLVDLQEDDNTVLRNVNADTLRLNSSGRILDGKATTISVGGLADLRGQSGIRLGDNGIDVFNAGSLTFSSNGQVSITEKSDMRVVGNNDARSMNLRSSGSITDDDNANIAVSFQSGFSAANVQIGDTATDSFNTNSLYFFTSGRFDVSEDSAMHVIEAKNAADSMRLRSTGAITDESNTWITVANRAEFDAASVNLGDTTNDQFNAGTIEFDTSGQFHLTENSDVNIAGSNTAGSAIVNSVGTVTNTNNADIKVEGAASFFGDSITLGNRVGDNLQLGGLTFNTSDRTEGTKIVSVIEDDATTLVGTSRANSARIESGGIISDGPQSDVGISGNLELITGNNGGIVLGDSGTPANAPAFDAIFNAGSLTVRTDGTGNVNIQEDSGIFLIGNNRANSMRLVADGGQANVTDSQTASTTVQFNLDVTGDLINLGTGIDTANGNAKTDFLSFSTLTFNSNGNTNISADSDILLLGDSRSDAALLLESTGSITDHPTAKTFAQTAAVFTAATDVVIGELATDSFDIINGTEATINAPGQKIAIRGVA